VINVVVDVTPYRILREHLSHKDSLTFKVGRHDGATEVTISDHDDQLPRFVVLHDRNYSHVSVAENGRHVLSCICRQTTNGIRRHDLTRGDGELSFHKSSGRLVPPGLAKSYADNPLDAIRDVSEFSKALSTSVQPDCTILDAGFTPNY
jgi:hypothetical protein